jgi:hypothetical protein
MDIAGLDALDDPVMDQFAGIAAPDALDEADGLAGALRRHWVIPAVFLVQNIAQGVVVLLVAGWRDVEAAPAHQLHARRDEMQLDAALVGVAYPKHIALVGFETGKGKALEGVHHLPLLGMAWRVLRREGDDAGAIGPLVRACVDQRAHAVCITAQHFRQGLAGKQHDLAALVADRVAVLVVSDDVALDQVVNRSRSAALAVAEELDQHGAPSWAVNCSRVSDSARSMATRRAATVIASMAGTWPCAWAVFSHRAIWLRLPPIRATARTSSGSTLGTGRRRRASVRPSASRISVAKGRPALAARAVSACFSAAVQRKTTTALSSPLGDRRVLLVGFEGEACLPSQGSLSEGSPYDRGRLAPFKSLGVMTPSEGRFVGRFHWRYGHGGG